MAQQGSKHDPARSDSDRPQAPDGPIDRRKLLRRSAALLPTIVTLYSGAAAARSSNALRLADTPTRDGRGYLCVDKTSGRLEGNTLDAGNHRPEVRITRISERQYYRVDSDRGVSIDEMCRHGGEYRYKESGGYGKSSVDGELDFVESEFADQRFDGDGAASSGDFDTNELADASGFETLGKGGGGGPGGGSKGWKKVRVDRGGFCSTAALLSFSQRGSVRIRDI